MKSLIVDKLIFLVCFLILNAYSNKLIHRHKLVYKNNELSSKCCNHNKIEQNHRFEVKFSTKVVQNEYIITFNNYYKSAERENFLNAALNSKVFKWKIIPRLNPASDYPSDFDVILLEEEHIFPSLFLQALRNHPAVKRVTSQLMVHRSLKYIPVSEEEENSVVENFIHSSALHKTSDYQHKIKNTTKNWHASRRLLRAIPRQITSVLRADMLWSMGITGVGIKVAVFDTGLTKNHPHFKRIKERTNWTNEKSLDDGVSHGTFVAGVIASAKECLGFAPDADLHIYRVFTNNQVSYTSWFLDAFNYAILKKINVLNLSIGGPDFLDQPFVDKVLELTANKVIMVSAIGNDGPLYGTLNNPGDQSDVIGVGGMNFEENIAKFSSRGMTTWELPNGYGRLKPDIVTYGSQVKGSNIRGGCRSLSGTSVASPVVAGAVTLIASGVLHKMDIINPSSVKQALMEGATRLHNNNMFEQGHGKLNILKSMNILSTYVPKITLSPPYLDITEEYMWPYNTQALFYTSSPIISNVTILNGMGVIGTVLNKPTWHPNAKENGNLLNISISVSPVLWPWSGWMAVHIVVKKDGSYFEGIAQGHITLTVQSLAGQNETEARNASISFPIKIKIISKPPRHKRILWDQYHSLRYPPGYLPRDNLKIKSDPLDWRADHIHTNFKDMYTHLRNAGYYIEVLGSPFTCFNASNYGTLLIVDPEEEFFDEEIEKLKKDVHKHDLSVIIFADWYNTTVMKKIKFFDENTRQWWIPDTGGSNIPALNELLRQFGIGLGDFVAEGYFHMGDHSMYYASGSTIVRFPKSNGSILIEADLHDQGHEILKVRDVTTKERKSVPILGLLQLTDLPKNFALSSDELRSSYEENEIMHTEVETDVSLEKNPIINKRILLENFLTSDERNQAIKDRVLKFDNNIIIKNLEKFDDLNNNDLDLNDLEPELNEEKNYKQKTKYEKKKQSIFFTKVKKTVGRIAVYGDSNCLDSTHLEKPCYWLLDALLEFTMNSYLSKILKDMNTINNIVLPEGKPLPLRLPGNNLHHYSKVLDPNNILKKRDITICKQMLWEQPIFLNITDQHDLQEQRLLTHNSNKIEDGENSSNLLRKLESQKAILVPEDLELAALRQNNKKKNMDDENYNKHIVLLKKKSGRLNKIIYRDEELNYLFVLVLLTFLVIILFINWFKKRSLNISINNRNNSRLIRSKRFSSYRL